MAEPLRQTFNQLNSSPTPTGFADLPGGGGFDFNDGLQFDLGVLGNKKQKRVRNRLGLSADQRFLTRDQIGNRFRLKKKIASRGGKSFNPSVTYTADPNSQNIFNTAQSNIQGTLEQGFNPLDPKIQALADREVDARFQRESRRLGDFFNNGVQQLTNDFVGSNAPGTISSGLGNVISRSVVQPVQEGIQDLSNRAEQERSDIINSYLNNARLGLTANSAIDQRFTDAGGIVGLNTALNQANIGNQYMLGRDQLGIERMKAMNEARYNQAQLDAMPSPFGQLLGTILGGAASGFGGMFGRR